MTEKITTESFEMNYFRFGNGSKVIAVIPGVSVTSVMGAEDQIAQSYAFFKDEFTVYVFDRRLNMPPVYTVSDMARDTAEAFMALGLKDVYIFGASQGGMIALEIGIEYPDLVKKIAVGSTTSDLSNARKDVFEEWKRLAEQKDRKGLYLAFGEKLYPRALFEQFRDTLIAASETATDEDLSRFIICLDGMKDFNITDRIKEIKCPVLVIGTYEDEVLDSDMTMQIAECLDEREDAELYLYKGFGHASFDTAPDYTERLYRFFIK